MIFKWDILSLTKTIQYCMIIIQRSAWISATNPKGMQIYKTNGKELNGQRGKWVELLTLVNEAGQQKLMLFNYKLKFLKRIV